MAYWVWLFQHAGGILLERASMEPHVTQIRVRYAEADQMGVVHHSNYFVYLEMARTEALRSLGLAYRDIEAEGAFLVVAKAACSFHAPARYDDLLNISTSVKRITTTRIDHAYEIRREGGNVLIAKADTTLACVDRQGKLRPLPGCIMSLLAHY